MRISYCTTVLTVYDRSCKGNPVLRMQLASWLCGSSAINLCRDNIHANVPMIQQCFLLPRRWQFQQLTIAAAFAIWCCLCSLQADTVGRLVSTYFATVWSCQFSSAPATFCCYFGRWACHAAYTGQECSLDVCEVYRPSQFVSEYQTISNASSLLWMGGKQLEHLQGQGESYS